MDPRWYYTTDGKTLTGPVPLAELHRAVAAGLLQPAHMVRREDSRQWSAAGTHSELFPPAPAARPDPPTFLSRVGGVLSSVGGVFRSAWQEVRARVRMFGLRRKLRRQQAAERQMLGELGSILLARDVAVPEGQELAERFRKLNQQYLLAQQAGFADRAKRHEAQQVQGQLQDVYAEYGRLALDGPGQFDGRADWLTRWQRLKDEQETTEKQAGELAGHWRAAPARYRREVLAGLGAVAALVVVAATFLWLGRGSKGSGETGDQGQEAARAFLESCAEVRGLEGRALEEARSALRSDEAAGALKARGVAFTEEERERQLRTFLRDKWSAEARRQATRVVGLLNERSAKLVKESAGRLRVDPEDFVLEWLTFEGTLDLAMMTRLWQERANYKGEAAEVVRSLLAEADGPPHIDKGVTVTAREGAVEVRLFGARVVEEVLADPPAEVRQAEVKLSRRSDHRFVREMLRNGKPERVSPETVWREGDRFAVDHSDALETYLAWGHSMPWATRLFEQPSAPTATARDEALLARLADRPARDRPARTMRELFREYSPAVPVVEAVGVGSGSGFVVQHRGRLLVVTNRHVIEGARDGVVLKFIQPARGGEKELVIGAGRTRVSAIHRAADLALVSLPPDAETELRRFGVVPVELAVSDHRPEEGEHVFAIGHPAGGDKVLTRTLSDGIVSGVGRKVDDASYLQVTVPINPGNSGGPLFDDRGCVVGVNTLTIRHSRSSQVALEALNFSLEVRAVHELLNLPARSLGEKEIAAVLRPTAEPTADVAAAVEGKLRKYAGMDYVPYTGRLASSSRLLRIPARSSDGVTLRFRIGATYAALLFTPDGRKVGAGIVGPDGKVVAAEPPDGAVELVYEPTSNGTHSIAVVNEADEDTAVFLVVLRK